LPLGFAEIAALLARWIEADLGEPAHIIGNSMGGQIAIHLAAARPDVVRSLVLVNSTGIRFRVAPAEHVSNFFLPRGFWSFLIILARDVFRAGPTSIGLAFSRLLRDDSRDLMRQLRVPVLLVWGESDPLVPLRYGIEMLREIRNSKLEVIPRAGHVPMWENPAAFNDVVLRFLEGSDYQQIDPTSSVFSWAISGWSGGIAYRQAGRRPNIVLVHGLGMSSAYFIRLAKALFSDEWRPVAPDLPGFGESVDAPPAGPADHARALAAWADLAGIEDAVWVGHSLGCNVVAHLAASRPDLVASSIHIGPLWRRRTPWLLLPALVIDAMQEPAALFPFVARAYWRTGFARWFRTFRRYARDIHEPPPAGVMIVGERDPLVARKVIGEFTTVRGAHACHFSDPISAATAVTAPRSSSRSVS
jgi:pimeloyl-ACP methyl ester carboxylesterase